MTQWLEEDTETLREIFIRPALDTNVAVSVAR